MLLVARCAGAREVIDRTIFGCDVATPIEDKAGRRRDRMPSASQNVPERELLGGRPHIAEARGQSYDAELRLSGRADGARNLV